jgi:ribosome-binding protein aMBF1 (putative translation factor)
MPTCRSCGEEVESLTSVNIQGKARKLCEDCAEMAQQQDEIAEQSESAVQEMMGFTGRR